MRPGGGDLPDGAPGIVNLPKLTPAPAAAPSEAKPTTVEAIDDLLAAALALVDAKANLERDGRDYVVPVAEFVQLKDAAATLRRLALEAAMRQWRANSGHRQDGGDPGRVLR